MNKIISLYRDAVRDDWDKQTDATLANMQEAEQNILSHLSAGEAAVKKVAELENEIVGIKSRTWCAYCGYEIAIDNDAPLKIESHIFECEKHPVGLLCKEVERLNKQLDVESDLRQKILHLEDVLLTANHAREAMKMRIDGLEDDHTILKQQASAGQRAVDAMEQNILSIVDACFHAFASSFRNDAKEMAEDLIKTIIQQSKEAR